MKKLLLCLIVGLIPMFAMAAQANIANYDKLTESQKADIALQVAKAAESNGEVPTVDKATQWANLGVEIGKAMSGTARELGVVANEFINTPAGKITLGLIIWKMAGGMIVHVFGGLLLLAILIPIWFYMYRRVTVSSVRRTPMEMAGKVVYDTHTSYENTVDTAVPMYFALAIIVGASLITIFTY